MINKWILIEISRTVSIVFYVTECLENIIPVFLFDKAISFDAMKKKFRCLSNSYFVSPSTLNCVESIDVKNQ